MALGGDGPYASGGRVSGERTDETRNSRWVAFGRGDDSGGGLLGRKHGSRSRRKACSNRACQLLPAGTANSAKKLHGMPPARQGGGQAGSHFLRHNQSGWRAGGGFRAEQTRRQSFGRVHFR